MLILAGVAIVTLTGENGILERARLAKEKTSEAQEEESQTLENYEEQIKLLGNRQYGNLDYSAKEQDTGTKWTDGKKIYQRTFVSNTFTYDSTRKWIRINDDDIENMDIVVSIEGIIQRGDGGFEDLGQAGMADNDFHAVYVYPSNKSINVVTKNGDSNPNSKVYVTLRYTRK